MGETFVRVDPSVHSGRPLIGNYSVDAIAAMVWDGQPLDDVAEHFALTVPQVLVACWFQARYGTSEWCVRWGDWARDAESLLWHGTHDKVDDPPAVNHAS